MKRVLLSVAVVLLAAGSLSAEQVQAVLTPENVLYTSQAGKHGRLDVQRKNGEANQLLIVPETEDDAIESQARLAWDNATSTLFVVWIREFDQQSEIRFSSFSTRGVWSEPVVLQPPAFATHAQLQIVVTYVPTNEEGARATLLHAVWWSIGPTGPSADYALVAFENGVHVSTEVAKVESLDAAMASQALTLENEEAMPPTPHPALAMVRRETGVEIAYGAPRTTIVKRVTFIPRIAPDARIWIPGRSGGGSTPRSPLMAAANGAPLHGFISSQGRLVLYAPDTQFRYSVFDGEWSAVQMIKLDEKVSSDELIEYLRNTLDQMGPVASEK